MEMITAPLLSDYNATTDRPEPSADEDDAVDVSDEYTAECLVYALLVDFIGKTLLSVFGLVGNTLTCMIMWKERKTSVTSFLLIVLAAVDDFALIVWSGQMALPAFCRMTHWCPGYLAKIDAANLYGWFLGSVSHMMSTWVVVMVTVHRFVSVCLPHKSITWETMSKVKVRVAIVLTACVVFCIPRAVHHYITYDDEGHMVRKPQTWAGPVYDYVYNVFLYYLVIYVIPLTTLTYCTYRLIRSLREAAKKREEMTRQARDRVDLTFSLVIVVVVYMVCQLSNPIRRILFAYYPRAERGCGHPYYYYISISTGMVAFNSAVNFPVFVLCARRFRLRLRSLFGKNNVVGVEPTVGNQMQNFA